MKKSYYKEYTAFVEENYPTFFSTKIRNNTNSKQKEQLKSSVDSIYKILLHIEIIQQVSDQKKQFPNYINEVHELIHRMLLVLPLNDQYLLDVLFRAVSESLLRLIISKSPQNQVTFTSSQHMSYTSIKKVVITDSFLFSRRKKFNYLYQLFSACSKSLHSPTMQSVCLDYLNDQFAVDLNYRTLHSRLNQINKLFYDFIISNIYCIRKSDLTISNRININKMLNKTEINAYYQLQS